MTSQPFDSEDFDRLLLEWADGSLSDSDWERFSALLEGSAQARIAYVEYATLQAMLELVHLPSIDVGTVSAGTLQPEIQHPVTEGPRPLPPGEGTSFACTSTVARRKPAAPVLGFLSGLLQVGTESHATAALAWLALASLCSGIVLTIFFCIVLVFRGGINPHVDAPQVAEQKGEWGKADTDASNPPSAFHLSPSGSTVVRLIHAADCHWAIGSHSPHLGDDLEPGRKLVLLSGLAEIIFESGVKALLQGPATLEVGSRTSATLLRGKLNVTVLDPELRGFQVRTPGMTYTDRGTEFGVFVAKDGSQEMHVFRGKVQADEGGTHPPSLIPHPSSLILSASQAVRISAPGKPVEKIAADEKQFVRRMPATELDLVDVAAGGDGLSGRRNRAINPTNGEYRDAPHGRDNIILRGRSDRFKSDHKYHRVPASTLIDGVFVVEGGAGPVQLDSAGHSFAKFPRTADTTSKFIWAVGGDVAKTGMLDADKMYVYLSKFGSVDYTSAGHGMLYMRSNKGITFDLEAIRRAQPQYRLLRFTAAAAEPLHPEGKAGDGKGHADFWVFVDGELRFEKRHVAPQKEEIPVAIDLAASNRFLTLVTTDDGEGDDWEWTLFADPKLKLGEAGK